MVTLRRLGNERRHARNKKITMQANDDDRSLRCYFWLVVHQRESIAFIFFTLYENNTSTHHCVLFIIVQTHAHSHNTVKLWLIFRHRSMTGCITTRCNQKSAPLLASVDFVAVWPSERWFVEPNGTWNDTTSQSNWSPNRPSTIRTNRRSWQLARPTTGTAPVDTGSIRFPWRTPTASRNSCNRCRRCAQMAVSRAAVSSGCRRAGGPASSSGCESIAPNRWADSRIGRHARACCWIRQHPLAAGCWQRWLLSGARTNQLWNSGMYSEFL